MSKHIITDSDLYRIDLDDGDWIDILEKVPKIVRSRAQSAAAKIKAQANAGAGDIQQRTDVSMDFDSGEFYRVLLHGMIKGWSFMDKSGKPLPVTPENIDCLDEDTSDFVLEEINRLNPARSKVQKKG